jgi:hypothetical protein
MPATIMQAVTVSVTNSVAAQLIASARIERGDASCWRLPDGSQTTDPRAALTDALTAIAAGDSDPTADPSSNETAIEGDVTFTIPGALAVNLLEYAGQEHSDNGVGWRTRDGREDDNPAVALTDAVVAIAEDDLAAEFIEPDKE